MPGKMNVAIADALAGSGVHDRRVGEGAAGAGVAGAGKKRKKKGGLLTLTALDSMKGNQDPTVNAGLTAKADRVCQNKWEQQRIYNRQQLQRRCKGVQGRSATTSSGRS